METCKIKRFLSLFKKVCMIFINTWSDWTYIESNITNLAAEQTHQGRDLTYRAAIKLNTHPPIQVNADLQSKHH